MKVLSMIRSQVLIGLLSVGISSSFAEGAVVSETLQFKFNYQLQEQPLTTDQVGELDPHQPNPPAQRWMVGRRVELVGLEGLLKKDGKFGVKASGVSFTARGFIRESGRWYSPFSAFACEKKPHARFATEVGAQFAAAEAADLWAKSMKAEMGKLSLLLSRISESSEAAAVNRGQVLLVKWLDSIEGEIWRRSQITAREKEWESYLAKAQALKLCEKPHDAVRVRPASLLDPLQGHPPKPTDLLARAPARLWNGLFSVRLDITVGKKILNGRFLIDSSAKRSVISPSWLESQGIYPALVELRDVPFERATWSGLWSPTGKLAASARVDQVRLSGLTLPMTRFVLAETDFFHPPEHLGSCCDGILGTDFLRLYPMEFQAAAPAEVKVWPRERFQWSAETPWVEVFETPRGDLMSDCRAIPLDIAGVRWDLGSQEALSIHTPWQASAKKVKPNQWQIECSTLKFAQKVPASFPQPPSEAPNAGHFTLRVPGVSVGVPLLSRGRFTLDLPHGRIWFEAKGLNTALPSSNQSGLELAYDLENGDRVLKVQAIHPKSVASALSRAGLKPGMAVTQIDGKPTSNLDVWEVNQRLAGVYGPVVSLQWKTREGLKMFPFQVR